MQQHYRALWDWQKPAAHLGLLQVAHRSASLEAHGHPVSELLRYSPIATASGREQFSRKLGGIVSLRQPVSLLITVVLS